MANTDAKRGLDIILTIDNKVVGGQRNATLNREAEVIDITNKVSAGWTENMTSVKSWSIEGDGIFVVDDAALDAIETAFLNGDWVQVKVADESWGYTGRGVITDFPIEANYDDAATYTITITGSGALEKIVPNFNVTGSKILTVADDQNKVVSQANQDMLTVTQSGDVITASVDVNALNSFASTDPNQGTGKWIGFVIDTGESTIIGTKYNGSALTQADVDEAASIGVGAGKFVLWLKAEAGNKSFVLSKEGKTDTTVAIVINNTGA